MVPTLSEKQTFEMEQTQGLRVSEWWWRQWSEGGDPSGVKVQCGERREWLSSIPRPLCEGRRILCVSLLVMVVVRSPSRV